MFFHCKFTQASKSDDESHINKLVDNHITDENNNDNDNNKITPTINRFGYDKAVAVLQEELEHIFGFMSTMTRGLGCKSSGGGGCDTTRWS